MINKRNKPGWLPIFTKMEFITNYDQVVEDILNGPAKPEREVLRMAFCICKVQLDEVAEEVMATLPIEGFTYDQIYDLCDRVLDRKASTNTDFCAKSLAHFRACTKYVLFHSIEGLTPVKEAVATSMALAVKVGFEDGYKRMADAS